jgi:hypothetical protein
LATIPYYGVLEVTKSAGPPAKGTKILYVATFLPVMNKEYEFVKRTIAGFYIAEVKSSAK